MASERPAEATGRAAQGGRIGHEGPYSPDVAWRALPGSYFGLVRRLVDVCPRLEVIKRSVCIEGARRAFARAKVHWAKLDAVKLVNEGPPEGKVHRHPEMYHDSVLKGARLVAEECAKDVIFE